MNIKMNFKIVSLFLLALVANNIRPASMFTEENQATLLCTAIAVAGTSYYMGKKLIEACRIINNVYEPDVDEFEDQLSDNLEFISININSLKAIKDDGIIHAQKSHEVSDGMIRVSRTAQADLVQDSWEGWSEPEDLPKIDQAPVLKPFASSVIVPVIGGKSYREAYDELVQGVLEGDLLKVKRALKDGCDSHQRISDVRTLRHIAYVPEIDQYLYRKGNLLLDIDFWGKLPSESMQERRRLAEEMMQDVYHQVY